MEERTERESDRREKKWQTCWCCRNQQRACRIAQASTEKLEHTGPAEKEWPQCHRESSRQERRSRTCQKETEQSRLSRVPDHEGERVKMGESRTLARKRGIRARAWRGKGGLHSERRQIPKRKERKHERVSERKSSPRRSARVLVSL